jgi:vacuolar-type H+-ATPase subunit I/STV1
LLVLAVVPLILMGWKEGGLHAFEAFLSAPSNTFSYLRIWALNIADFYFKSALFTALGILGAVIGNLLVMIIEGLIVFVQTLRLHWVEWFSKFYEGAGLGFAPYTEPMGWIVPA